MHAAILLVTKIMHIPGDLQYFSFLEAYSPLPGIQKETIPHPRGSDRPYIRFLLHPLIRTKGNRHVFITFMNVFLRLLREGYMDVIM